VLTAAVNGSVQRLRPIMMTMLVASFGLLPAAMSRGIGSDSQRPFAIVIVGGLVAALILGVFLLPTLYVWVAGERDVLPEVGSEGGGRVVGQTALPAPRCAAPKAWCCAAARWPPPARTGLPSRWPR